jgi:hypothetical protein
VIGEREESANTPGIGLVLDARSCLWPLALQLAVLRPITLAGNHPALRTPWDVIYRV